METKFYQHFKGGLYQLLYIAKNSETMENMVVYKSLLEEKSVWVRPEKMFFEQVNLQGKSVPRFKPITIQDLEQLLTKQ